MSHKLLKGKEISKPISANAAIRAAKLRDTGWQPTLASLQIGDNKAAQIYIRNQKRVCEGVGINFDQRDYPTEITQNEILAAIQSINMDPRVTGIILQRPVPPHLDLEQLQFAISPSKDVEGMHPANIGKIVYGNFDMGPCTAIASVEILKSTGLTLRGLDCVVVGHSEIVGKPIAFYLLEELATVTICHHGTRNLANFTRQADAVFVAVGKPGLITDDMIKPGAVVIDIGINSIEVIDEEGNKRRKTVGDVDFEAVHEVAGWITPVPGGVGPVTLAILVRNTVTAAEHQQRAYEKTMRIGFS